MLKGNARWGDMVITNGIDREKSMNCGRPQAGKTHAHSSVTRNTQYMERHVTKPFGTTRFQVNRAKEQTEAGPIGGLRCVRSFLPYTTEHHSRQRKSRLLYSGARPANRGPGYDATLPQSKERLVLNRKKTSEFAQKTPYHTDEPKT